MKKNLIKATLPAALLLLLLPSITFAHEVRTYEWGGATYQFTIGSLNEPLVVGDKSGVDLSITKNGKPLTGAETTLMVEIASGQNKKDLTLSTVYGTEGKYKSVFYPTDVTPISYRIHGTIDGTPIDDLFSCSAMGHMMMNMPDDTAKVKVSDLITRIGEHGSFGCPELRSKYDFPAASTTAFAVRAQGSRQFEAVSLLALALSFFALVFVNKKN